MGVAVEDVFVDDDRSVVDVSADPKLIGKVGAGDVLAEERSQVISVATMAHVDRMGLI